MAQDGAFTGTPTIVYQENAGTPTEYDATAIVGTWDFASTVEPDTGTYCIDATAVQDGDIMEFDNGSVVDAVAIRGRIHLEYWADAKGHNLALYIFNKTTQQVVGVEVSIQNYINTDLLDTYQTFVILLTDLGITGSQLDAIRIRVDSIPQEPNAPDFRLDNIQIEESGGGIVFRAEPLPGTWYHARYLKTIFTGIPTGFHTDGRDPLIDPYQLFNIAKLTNGIVNIIKSSGQVVEAINVKCLDDYHAIPEMEPPYILSKAADGTVSVAFRLEWAERLILKAEDGDYSELVVNDDLRGLGSLRVRLGGYYELRS